MRIWLTTALVATTLLTACGNGSGSSSSPFSGFGKSREARSAEPQNPLIPRQRRSVFRRNKEVVYDGVPLQQIVELSFERVAGGAILRATGLSATLGAYDVQLVPDENSAKGTLSYTMKARYSKRSRPSAPQTSRQVVAATYLTEDELLGIRNLRVSSASNARTVRRR